jgi:imidazolonepropionase-like amidohydrolase
MAEAGMSARQILASLTTAPALRFGASARLGRVFEGLAADLVVLQGDPLKDVGAFANVRYTLRDGRIVFRSATLAAKPRGGE